MPSLKELRERAGECHQKMVQIRDQYNERKEAGKTGAELWPDEARKAWEETNAEYDALRVQIDEEKRSVDLDRVIEDMEQQSRGDRRQGDDGGDDQHRNRPGQDDFRGDLQRDRVDRSGPPDAETRDLALQAWFGRRHEECRSERHVQAAQRCGLDLSSDEIVLDLYDTHQFRALQYQVRSMHPSLLQDREEQRALSAYKGTAGGFVVGSTLVNALERNMLAFGGVEQVASVIVTNTGEEMGWPTADDTSNEGEMLGENTATGYDEEPTLALVKWNAYEFSSKQLMVPVRLLEDAPTSFAEELGSMLGERIGRAKNRKFTTGTGNNQPKGIVIAATLGRTTDAATVIAADDILRLEHSVDPAYRTQGCRFMMHDNIVLEVRLLKDGEGRYMWRAGLQDGRPDSLNGYGVTINQHMDSAATASNKVILFGAMSYYKVRRVRQLVILRLKERRAEYRQEVFICFERADGNLLDAGTHPVKYMQMHA